MTIAESLTCIKEKKNPRPRAIRSARRCLLQAYKRGACSREKKKKKKKRSPGSQPITSKSSSIFAEQIMLEKGCHSRC